MAKEEFRVETKKERILRIAGEKVKAEDRKARREKFERFKQGISKSFERRDTSKAIERREKAIRGTLTALGIIRESYPSKRISNIRRLKQVQITRSKPYSKINSNINKQQLIEEYNRLRLQQALQQKQVNETQSESFRRLRDSLIRIQNKGRNDIARMNRINRERKALSSMMNLMKAHENMTNVNMDFTGVPEDNILLAPNTFKENPDDFILKQKRLTLMQTREGGNNLNFF